jgi:hypothetical protein
MQAATRKYHMLVDVVQHSGDKSHVSHLHNLACSVTKGQASPEQSYARLRPEGDRAYDSGASPRLQISWKDSGGSSPAPTDLCWRLNQLVHSLLAHTTAPAAVCGAAVREAGT